MITLTVTEAARHFSDLVNRIRYQREEATLLKGGRPVARIVPVQTGASGAELARLWPSLPRLGVKEATLLAGDREAAARNLATPKSPWE